MLLFLLSTALADPMLIHLKEGDVAPFDGRLMNDEAVANIIAGNEMSVEQCEIQKDISNCDNKSGTTTGNRLFKSRVGNRTSKECNSIGTSRHRDLGASKRNETKQNYVGFLRRLFASVRNIAGDLLFSEGNQ